MEEKAIVHVDLTRHHQTMEGWGNIVSLVG